MNYSFTDQIKEAKTYTKKEAEYEATITGFKYLRLDPEDMIVYVVKAGNIYIANKQYEEAK